MKTAISVFFLSLLITLPASAAEVSLQVPTDYKSTKILSLPKVTAFTFDFEGNYIVAEDLSAPATKRRGAITAFRINKVAPDGTTTTLLDRTGQGVINLSYYKGIPYIVTRGRIYKISKGKIVDVLGLPTYGDYGNTNIMFNNNYMYVAVGTATNSGIVGPDNTWLKNYPSVYDIPCATTKLSGVNIDTDNYLTEKKDDKARTGSFVTFNRAVAAGQIVYSNSKCSGSVLRATPDGVMTQVYAWGLHNPKNISIDDDGQVWVLDGGMEDRGVRPIKNGKDALYQVTQSSWYGWPDFSAGSPVDQPALLAEFPKDPTKPVATFDLGKLRSFNIAPKIFMANSGIVQSSDDKLQQINLRNSELSDYLSVTNGKILQYKFGPEDKLYVLISLADGKTELHGIEPTNPLVSTVVGSTKARSFPTNWLVGSMIAVLSAAGFFAIKNLRRPIPPL